jgi:DNA-binding CsgD family transcriptional regulator
MFVTDLNQRQSVLDAAAGLLAVRRASIAALGTQHGAETVRLVARGDRLSLGSWTMRQSIRWRQLLSTRPAVTGETLVRSLPNNRDICARGLRMTSVFDHESTDEAARALLEHEPLAAYHFAYAPVQMRIVDRREVLLEGPQQGDCSSILSLTSTVALGAAFRYWQTVTQTSAPCRLTSRDAGRLTDRQRAVMELLREGMTDERIGEVLGVCLRTVRTEVGRVMALLGVRSRFAAGFAYARLVGADGQRDGAAG